MGVPLDQTVRFSHAIAGIREKQFHEINKSILGGTSYDAGDFLGQRTIPRNVGDPIRRGRSEEKKIKIVAVTNVLSVYVQQDKLARFFVSNEFCDGTRSGFGDGNAADKNSKQT